MHYDQEGDAEVRSGFVCAHKYGKALLGFDDEQEKDYVEAARAGRPLPGMVRASVGLYTNQDDIRRILAKTERMVSDQEIRRRVKAMSV